MKSTTRRARTEAGSGRVTLVQPDSAGALSTTELLAVARRELRREQAASRGNQRRILRTGVARLGDMGLVSTWERDRLNRVGDLVLAGARSAKAARDATGRLQAIHDEMLARDAGRLALTIAEVAANSGRLSAIPQDANRRRAKARAAQDPSLGRLMIGGVAGALAGGLAGGPVGAVIGFIGGWVGRGFMESC